MERALNLAWKRTNRAWLIALEDQIDRWDSHRPVDGPVYSLCVRLLSFGGTHVCVPYQERNVERILQRGELARPIELRIEPGQAQRCHTNSAQLWMRSRHEARLFTGYALAYEGRGRSMWRKHSWLVNGQDEIIETTEPRVAYFGMGLSYLEALWFSLRRLRSGNNPL